MQTNQQQIPVFLNRTRVYVYCVWHSSFPFPDAGTNFQSYNRLQATALLFQETNRQLTNLHSTMDVVPTSFWLYAGVYLWQKNNCLADGLSQNPVGWNSSAEEQAEFTICFLLTSTPLDLMQAAEHTVADSTLQAVINAIQGRWVTADKCTLPTYYKLCGELSVKDIKKACILCHGLGQSFTTGTLETLRHSKNEISHLLSCMVGRHVFWYRIICQMLHGMHHSPKESAPGSDGSNWNIPAFEKVSVDLTGPSSIFDGAVVLTVVFCVNVKWFETSLYMSHLQPVIFVRYEYLKKNCFSEYTLL